MQTIQLVQHYKKAKNKAFLSKCMPDVYLRLRVRVLWTSSLQVDFHNLWWREDGGPSALRRDVKTRMETDRPSETTKKKYENPKRLP